jgi:hypothetical protein
MYIISTSINLTEVRGVHQISHITFCTIVDKHVNL